MSYVVLARRWRPQHFEEVIGQEHVGRTLANAIAQDRVAHAFLFCGPRGVGKTSTARILAKALNCAQGPTPKPCYACPSCREISSGGSMDVIEIDGASNRGVNEIRELREGVHYAPSRDRFKVYIIDEVHMLTTEAFNALLKTLEEPPPHVKFIFATTEPQKIPVTILSRCQRFDFKRIPLRRIATSLQEICAAEGIEAEPSALALIATQADGGMRDALSLTDQIISFCGQQIREAQVAEVLGVAGRQTLFRLTGALLGRQVEEALRVVDEVNQAGFDLVTFASSVVAHLRDLAVIQASREPEGLIEMSDAELAQARAQLQRADASVLTRMFNLMVSASEDMARSAYPKLVFEMALVRLAAVEPLVPMELILQRLDALSAGVILEDSWTPPTGSAAPAAPAAPPPSSPPPPPSSPPAAAKPAEAKPAPAAIPAPAAPAPIPAQPRAAAPAPAPIPAQPPRPAPAPVQQPAAAVAPAAAAAPVEEPPPADEAPPRDAELEVVDDEDGFWEDEPAYLRDAPPPGVLVGATVDERVTHAAAPPPRPLGRAAQIMEELARQVAAQPTAAPVTEEEEGLGEESEPAPDPATLPPALSPEEARGRWRKISEYMHAQRSTLAHYYDHAWIISVRPGELRLAVEEDLSGLLTGRNRQRIVAWVARHLLRDLWAGPWGVHIEVIPEGQEPPGQQSLAAERAEALEARKERARQQIREHVLVTEAMALFTPTNARVTLDDDDPWS